MPFAGWKEVRELVLETGFDREDEPEPGPASTDEAVRWPELRFDASLCSRMNGEVDKLGSKVQQ